MSRSTAKVEEIRALIARALGGVRPKRKRSPESGKLQPAAGNVVTLQLPHCAHGCACAGAGRPSLLLLTVVVISVACSSVLIFALAVIHHVI